MKLLAIVGGGFLILSVLWDAFETIVLPHRVSRSFRPTRLFYALTWPPWRAVARRRRHGNATENFLSVFGPLSLLLLLATWALLLLFGYGMLHWGIGTHLKTPSGMDSFTADLYFSGTTLVTLGLGDVYPSNDSARILAFLESGMGFGLLALVVGYFPTLSQAFSRREVNVALLDARAGSPPTAGELIRRLGGGPGNADLGVLLRDWDAWSADLLETHISFPVLAYYRSQHDNQSWVAAMTAILDSCALIIALVENGPTRQARLTFAMARHAVADLCHVFDLDPKPPQPSRLSADARARLREALAQSGIAMQSGAASDRRLDELRAMYEPQVNVLSRRLLMPLPPWLPAAGVNEYWQATAPER